MKKAKQNIFFLGFSAIAIFAMTAGGSTASATPQEADLRTLGSTEGNSGLSASLVASIHRAERDDSKSFLSVTWSIENTGEKTTGIIWLRDRSYSYSNPNYAGVTAVSNDSGTRFHPIMDENGNCLCSGPTSNNITQQIEPDSRVAYWSLFSVPEDVETITIEIPGFDPIEDIPIS